MPRALRVLVSGGIYHVTVRGNNRQPIFTDTVDYQRYLAEARRCFSEYPSSILAYALMPNHVHLVLQDHRGLLSRSMQVLNARYTRSFNQRHQRVGHLYQGRFYARLVDQDSYLLEVTRYVHLNPVRAQLVDQPERYPWSSYRSYVGLEKLTQGFVQPQFIWELMGGDGIRSQVRYRQFVEDLAPQRLPAWERRLRRLKLIGSARLAHEMAIPIKCQTPNPISSAREVSDT